MTFFSDNRTTDQEKEKRMKELDRRQFLKGSLIAGASTVAGGLALSGCSSPAVADNPLTDATTPTKEASSYLNRPKLDEPTKTIQTDFCICGAGGCGLSAAIQAHELGLEVILLEKKSAAGGTFGFSEITYALNSTIAKNAGFEIDVAEQIKGCLEYSHSIPSHELYLNFFSQTGETIDWVQTFGCEFQTEADRIPSGTSLYYAGDTRHGAGFEFIAHFVDAAEQRGIEIMYDTAAQELVIENEKVVGVLAVDSSGKVIRIEAPAVLLSTGGWGSNQEMLKEVGEVDPEKITAAGYDGRDGDGIIMALNAGGQWARGKGTIMFFGPMMPGSNWGDELWAGTQQPTMWVNQDAKRFINEGIGDLIAKGNAMRDLDRTLVIASQADVDRFAEIGTWRNSGGFMPAGTKLTEFKSMLQKAIEENNEYCFVADTIEELAEKSGLDSKTFRSTVDRYNQMVTQGEDTEFGKSSDFLTPLADNGPYYAFDSRDAFYTTVGGLRINANTQVINGDGSAIKGLYAGGCDAGGLYGDSYAFLAAKGVQSSWAMNSGRLAAKHAAEYLGV
jgi:fumarate reductase flavoprotein subunit